jgi:hypothetical protein
MRRALCFMTICVGAVASSGCRTLHADREDFTKAEALAELRSKYPSMRWRDDYFTPPHGDPDRQLHYDEITEVRVKPIVPMFFLSPFTGFIFGPWWYGLWVTTKDGEEVKIYPLIRVGLNVSLIGLYPNVLIHGQTAGFALDWLRQYSGEK